MAQNYTHQRRPGGNYYARLRVPKDIQDAIGHKELTQSLGTSDRRLAEKLARKVVAGWEESFDRARMPAQLAENDFEAIAREYYRSRLEEDHVERRKVPQPHDEDELKRIARNKAQTYLEAHPDVADDEKAIALLAMDFQLNPDQVAMLASSRRVRLEHLRKNLPRRRYGLIAHEADSLISNLHLPVATETAEYERLCEALMRAEIDLIERQIERDAGIHGGTASDPMLREGHVGFVTTTFSDIIDEREKRSAKRLGGTTSEATLRKYRRIVKEFGDWRGSHRASTVSRKEVERWRDDLLDDGLSSKTVIDKVSCVKSVLSWGQKQSDGTLFAQGLPLEALELPSKETQDSSAKTYTKQQAAIILSAAREQQKAYLRWIPWLAAYSGARVTELLQLEKADVFHFEGSWFYRILHQGNRTTKTKRSRTVPLHPHVVEEGFLDFVSAAADGPLFGDTRMDGNLRDWIRTEVLPDLPEPRPSPMHGFRHLFEDLRIGTIGDDAAKYITGRAVSDSSGGYGKSSALLPALANQMAEFPRLI